jgi:hypothetical protein
MRDSKSESSGEVYLHERTCAHRAALARTCGLPGLEDAQHGATVEDIAEAEVSASRSGDEGLREKKNKAFSV